MDTEGRTCGGAAGLSKRRLAEGKTIRTAGGAGEKGGQMGVRREWYVYNVRGGVDGYMGNTHWAVKR